MIFTVVLGHAADNYTADFDHIRSLFFFIYIFHMPLFIFVSGLFAKKTVDQERFDRMAGYLVVYVFLKIYVFLIKFFAGENPVFKLFSESGAPWFMLALFAFCMITVCVRNLPKYIVFTVSIIFGCLIGYFSEAKDFLAISRVFVFYPFFYLGYCLNPQYIEEKCNGIIKKITAFAVLIVSGFFVLIQGDKIYWLRYLLTGRNPYDVALDNNNLCDFPLPDFYEKLGFLFRFIYYIVVFAVCACIVVLIPKKTPFGICAKLGQRTLSVYGLHFGVLYLIFDVFNLKTFFADIFPWHSELIIFPIAILTTLLLSMDIFYFPINYLMNLPSKITEKIKKIQP